MSLIRTSHRTVVCSSPEEKTEEEEGLSLSVIGMCDVAVAESIIFSTWTLTFRDDNESSCIDDGDDDSDCDNDDDDDDSDDDGDDDDDDDDNGDDDDDNDELDDDNDDNGMNVRANMVVVATSTILHNNSVPRFPSTMIFDRLLTLTTA